MLTNLSATAQLLTNLSATAQQKTLDSMIDRDLASLVATYKMLHAAPELSHYEEKTSAFVAKELRTLGYTVTERIGKYKRPEWIGYGVVGVLKNGAGPTVLVRADLDALPVEEKTGLSYASKVRVKNEAGQEVGVMHACGHDVHITALVGAAKMLAQLKDEWRGTLVLVGPACGRNH
ncbi:MAG: M20/M25/M40 family metallo-hydrolase [Pyrinomonadaceae bacterium]